jgi:acyl-CoA synthetase (AMP-forming)/AMP-acid ligase II
MARSSIATTPGAGVPRLDALLTQAAFSAPHRTAVIFDATTWTYREVHERARRLAAGLSSLGVKHGDRVALWTSNRAEFVEVLFGVPMLGAIAAPLDHWWTWKDAQVALEQIRPKVLIVDSSKGAAIADVQDAIEAFGIDHVLNFDTSYAQLLDRADPLKDPSVVNATDPALILFTSGSTGRSKGAVHSHGGLVATAATMKHELRLVEAERTLHFLPMFSSCLEQLIPLVHARATHVILAHFDASAVWEAVRSYEITHFDAVPTTLRRMLEVLPKQMPSTLRMISYASERMPDALITSLIERLPGVAFIQFYGMIEHLCITVLEAADQLRKIGTVGRPMIGTELYLVNEAGEVSSDSESGEIVARSRTLFKGYWQDATATEQVMRGEWMRTGDFGRFDSEGFLLLEGRVKEMIKTGGLTVIPSEIENVLLTHAGVRDAVVVGVPDERWGEAVHAFVTLARGASPEEAELKQFCKERLAGYKCPKSIQIVQELPKTGIGKIARRLVRDQVSASSLEE